MSTQIQRRRGTTTEHSSFTGAEGEITIDTTKDTVVVHDGVRAGGFPLAHENNPSFTGTVEAKQLSNNALDAFRATDANGTRLSVTAAGLIRIYDSSLTNNVEIGPSGAAKFYNTGTNSTWTLDAVSNDGRGGRPTLRLKNLAAGDSEAFSVLSSDGSTTNAFITSTGKATFAGDVVSGTYAANSNYIALRGPGQLEIARNTTADNLTFINGTRYNGGVAEENFKITTDGSASFASTVKSESPSGTFSALNPGYIVIQQPGTSSSDLVFRARNSVGSEVVEFWGDGSATFSSTVSTTGAQSYVRVNRTGSLSNSAALYQGVNNNVLKFKVAADGSVFSAGKFTLREGSTDAWSIDNNGANGYLRFYDEYNNSERVRIDNNGNIGIGTTSPSHPITILDDQQYKGLQLKNSSTNNLILGGYTSANKNGFIQFYKEDGTVGALLKQKTIVILPLVILV